MGNDHATYDFELAGFLSTDKPPPTVSFPRVTTILRVLGANQRVIDWAYRRGVAGETDPETHRQVRSELGTEAHAKFERLNRHELHPDVDDEDGFYRAISRWWLRENLEEAEKYTELTVYSKKMDYAGTADLVWYRGDDLIVTDLKTGNKNRRPYTKDMLQVTAYAMALEEMDGEPVASGSVLVAREDGTFSHKFFPISKEWRRAWKQVRRTYDALEAL